MRCARRTRELLQSYSRFLLQGSGRSLRYASLSLRQQLLQYPRRSPKSSHAFSSRVHGIGISTHALGKLSIRQFVSSTALAASNVQNPTEKARRLAAAKPSLPKKLGIRRRKIGRIHPPTRPAEEVSEDAARMAKWVQESGGSKKSSVSTVALALAGNSVITVLKFIVWIRTGSSAMFAEAIHTLMDSVNQSVLLLGLRHSSAAPDSRHPYGYGRAAFFWGLVSALGTFWCGAGVTTVHGLMQLANVVRGEPTEVLVNWESWAVLAASLAIDGAVLVQATQTLFRRAEAEDPGAAAVIQEAVQEVLAQGKQQQQQSQQQQHSSGSDGQEQAASTDSTRSVQAVQPSLSSGQGGMPALPHARRWPLGPRLLEGLSQGWMHEDVANSGASWPVRTKAQILRTWMRFKLLYRHLMTTNDPFVVAVFLEDSAACLGVILAAGGIALTHITANPVFDALASICIGGLLGGVAVRMVKMNQTFLLGQSVDAETEHDIRDMIDAWPSIEHVGEVQTQWLGPKAFSFKAEVDFDGTWLAAKLHSEYQNHFLQSKDLAADLPVLLSYYAEDVTRVVERELKDVEDTIRSRYPHAAFIELEPDSTESDRHMVQDMGDERKRATERRFIMRAFTDVLAQRRARKPDDPNVDAEQQVLKEWFAKAQHGKEDFPSDNRNASGGQAGADEKSMDLIKRGGVE